jgi:hypothetical protein
MVILSVFTCGILTSLLGLIEGIIYLTKSDEEFYQTYQVGKKSLLKQKIPILKSGFFYEKFVFNLLTYFVLVPFETPPLRVSLYFPEYQQLYVHQAVNGIVKQRIYIKSHHFCVLLDVFFFNTGKRKLPGSASVFYHLNQPLSLK